MSAYHGGAAPGEARRRRDREVDPSWRDNELHALCADEAVTVERVEAGDGYAAMATERSRTTQGQLPLLQRWLGEGKLRPSEQLADVLCDAERGGPAAALPMYREGGVDEKAEVL